MVGANERLTGVVRRGVLLGVGCLLAAALLPAAAAADLGQEEVRGRAIAESVSTGERGCSDLSAEEFELVGEYAMGRYLGDGAAHEAMNAHMVAMMGEGGERRMHVALGYRYSGCRGGPAGSWMGPMAGMMLGGGGHEGGGYGPGMMGGYASPAGGEDEFDGPSAAAMVGMMAVLIGAAAAAVLWLSRRRDGPRPNSARETLRRRFASGELDEEQYQERKRLLEGS